jgi:hypothetical protein
VPLLRDGTVHGAIVLQSYVPGIVYSPEDQALLEFVGSHVITADISEQPTERFPLGRRHGLGENDRRIPAQFDVAHLCDDGVGDALRAVSLIEVPAPNSTSDTGRQRQTRTQPSNHTDTSPSVSVTLLSRPVAWPLAAWWSSLDWLLVSPDFLPPEPRVLGHVDVTLNRRLTGQSQAVFGVVWRKREAALLLRTLLSDRSVDLDGTGATRRVPSTVYAICQSVVWTLACPKQHVTEYLARLTVDLTIAELNRRHTRGYVSCERMVWHRNWLSSRITVLWT